MSTVIKKILDDRIKHQAIIGDEGKRGITRVGFQHLLNEKSSVVFPSAAAM